MDQRDVRAAWEKFVERGALSADLRSSVAASWQRSKNHRVTIDRARAPLVADAELFRLQARFTASCRAVRAREFENIPGRREFNHDPHRSHRIDHRYPGR